jgi:ribosomal protein S18 acetylase RimI-like enzyme
MRRAGMVVMRHMAREELTPGRIAEIDLSESGTFVYKYVDGEVERAAEEWHRPRRGPDGWEKHIAYWKTDLERGGVAIGAFDDGLLVGIAVLRYQLTDTMAQLAALFVSRNYRRQGIAARLTREVIRLAREDGARELYVSATPSQSAVGFYRSQGFRLAEQVNEALYELEPEDIHMITAL